jgi:hypothetical protein
MASLTNLFSIWIGLIMVGSLMFPQHWTNQYKFLILFAENPGMATKYLLENVFTSSATILIGTIFAGTIFGIATAGLSNFFLTQNYGVLFLIPALLIFTVFTYFLIPTNYIITTDMPQEIKTIYSIFMGGLVFITVVTFVGGRS